MGILTWLCRHIRLQASSSLEMLVRFSFSKLCWCKQYHPSQVNLCPSLRKYQFLHLIFGQKYKFHHLIFEQFVMKYVPFDRIACIISIFCSRLAVQHMSVFYHVRRMPLQYFYGAAFRGVSQNLVYIMQRFTPIPTFRVDIYAEFDSPTCHVGII